MQIDLDRVRLDAKKLDLDRIRTDAAALLPEPHELDTSSPADIGLMEPPNIPDWSLTDKPKTIRQQVDEAYGVAARYGMSLPQAEQMLQQRTFAQDLSGAIKKGGLSAAKGIVKIPEDELRAAFRVGFTGAKIGNIGGGLGPSFQFIPREKREQMDVDVAERNVFDTPGTLMNRIITQPTEYVAGGIDDLIRSHPEWDSEPPKNVLDLITNPRKLAVALAQSAPVLVSAGLLSATGHPVLSLHIVYGAEAQDAEDGVLAAGGTKEQARQARTLYGVTAAALELFQLNKGIALTKEIRDLIIARSARRLAAQGAEAASKQGVAIKVVENVTTEMMQGAWQEKTEKLTAGIERPGGWEGYIDRRLQDATIAAALTLTATGVGAALGVSQRGKTVGEPVVGEDGWTTFTYENEEIAEGATMQMWSIGNKAGKDIRVVRRGNQVRVLTGEKGTLAEAKPVAEPATAKAEPKETQQPLTAEQQRQSPLYQQVLEKAEQGDDAAFQQLQAYEEALSRAEAENAQEVIGSLPTEQETTPASESVAQAAIIPELEATAGTPGPVTEVPGEPTESVPSVAAPVAAEAAPPAAGPGAGVPAAQPVVGEPATVEGRAKGAAEVPEGGIKVVDLPQADQAPGAISVYHGTSSPITEIGTPGEQVYTTGNIYGQGFYTTDREDVAQGYTKKGEGTEPTVYRVSIPAEVEAKLYDMEAPLAPQMKQDMRQVLHEWDSDDYYGFSDLVDDPENKNLRELYDAIRSESGQQGIPADDIQGLFDAMRDRLSKQGYLGLKHTGGLILGKAKGKPQHVVRIIWNPKEDMRIGVVNPPSPVTAEAQPSVSSATAVKPVRFEAGKKLTKEQKAEVLRSIGDAYKDNDAPREVKYVDDRTGEEVYGYAYSPDSMYTSDITGKKIRHYVFLPDGRRAHPSELFPNITQSEVDKAVAAQVAASKEEQRRLGEMQDRAKRAGANLGQANLEFNKAGYKTVEGSVVYVDGEGNLIRIASPNDVEILEKAGWTKRVPGTSSPPSPVTAAKTEEAGTSAQPIPLEVVMLFDELRANHLDYKRAKSADQKADLFSRNEEIKEELAARGYDKAYIKAVETGKQAVPESTMPQKVAAEKPQTFSSEPITTKEKNYLKNMGFSVADILKMEPAKAREMIALHKKAGRRQEGFLRFKFDKEADTKAKIDKALSDFEKWLGTQPGKPEASTVERTEPDDPEAQIKERKFVTSLKEQGFVKPEVEAPYPVRNTEALAIKAANLVREDIDKAERMALTGKDENAVAVACELIKEYNRRQAAETDPKKKDQWSQKILDVGLTIAPKLTEQGRAIQAASILSLNTPEGLVRFAVKTVEQYNEAHPKKKVPNLTAAQVTYLLDELRAIEAMPDGIEKAKRFGKVLDYVQTLTPSTWFEKVMAVIKAGLLTGIKTSGLNTASNLMHGVTETGKDVPAVFFDWLQSQLTGKRTMTFAGKGSVEGFEKGIHEGWTYLRTGWSERDNIGEKLDWKRVHFDSKFGKTVLQRYVEFVFRALGAQDQPFYYGAMFRSLAGQSVAQAMNEKAYDLYLTDVAGEKKRWDTRYVPKTETKSVEELRDAWVAQAKREGVKGGGYLAKSEIREVAMSNDKIKSRAQEILDNPTDEMLGYAVLDAETAVFQNKTALGDIAAFMTRRIPGLEIVLPFKRTPSAIAMQILNYTPVGAIKTLYENFATGNYDQRILSQQLGRATLGTGVLWLGAELFRMGLLTLDRPETEREKELWKAEGRQANSIKIGGKWRSVQVLGPGGNVLVIGGQFAKGVRDKGSIAQGMASAWIGGAKSFSEQTFMRGLNVAVDALMRPDRSIENFTSSMAGMVVPTLVADIARATDESERRATGLGWQRIESRIPGLRQTLEPTITVFGQDLPRYGGNILEVMLDPTRPAKIRQDKVVDEIRRLYDAGYDTAAPTLLGDRKGYVGLTAAQNTELWRRAGEQSYVNVWQTIYSDEYAEGDDTEKAKLIDRAVQNGKTLARVEMAYTILNPLPPEARLRKLIELRRGKLITNEVHKELEQLL